MQNNNLNKHNRLPINDEISMIVLKKSQFYKVTHMFKDIKHNIPLVLSVLELTYPGRIFVDNIERPEVALLSLDDFLFISGNVDNEICSNTLFEVVYKEIFPQQKWQYLEIHTSSNEWLKTAEKIFEKKICIKRIRKTFRLNKEYFSEHHEREILLPEGYSISQIDDAFIKKFNLDKEFWSPISKRFGFFLVKDNEIISECISVFVGGKHVEIGIETKELYRRKGFAFITSIAFIKYCLSIGLEPNWACWEERKESIALAKKLGYEQVISHEVIVIGK